MTKELSKSDRGAAFRSIPSVDQLADAPALQKWREQLSPALIVQAARAVVDAYRDELIAAEGNGHLPVLTFDQLADRVEAALSASQRPVLGPVINATGIIIHTGLGRSPLAADVAQQLAEVASHYAPVELDMPTGQRGKRQAIVRDLLCQVTGAEAATVVNNNAAATLIVLAAVTGVHREQDEVIVSRGELVEIGGSFRLPEVMTVGGAKLCEIGTTNRTRAADYENAINEHTAALLKVHTSNFRIEGFTEAATIEQLVAIGNRRNVPVIDDVGSGALVNFERYGVGDEPCVRESVDAGADIVLFSGDKLIGGPQAGIIVGKKEWIARIDKHPMMRAMRLDKLILTALGATLQLHRDPKLAEQRVPVLAMLTATALDLTPRAERLATELQSIPGVDSAAVASTTCYLGGGSLPTQGVLSVGVRLTTSTLSETELAMRLRVPGDDHLPIIVRINDGAIWLEVRTIFPEQDEAVVRAVRAALA